MLTATVQWVAHRFPACGNPTFLAFIHHSDFRLQLIARTLALCYHSSSRISHPPTLALLSAFISSRCLLTGLKTWNSCEEVSNGTAYFHQRCHFALSPPPPSDQDLTGVSAECFCHIGFASVVVCQSLANRFGL